MARSLHDAITGGLLGAAAGDALGATAVFADGLTVAAGSGSGVIREDAGPVQRHGGRRKPAAGAGRLL